VGFFYVLDAITRTGAGQNQHRVAPRSPVGPDEASGYFKAGLVDAKMDFVYGGDLQGNVWRIDMSTSPPALMHMATLKDGAGNPQPISVRPVVTIQTLTDLLCRDRAYLAYRSVGHLEQSITDQGQERRLRTKSHRRTW